MLVLVCKDLEVNFDDVCDKDATTTLPLSRHIDDIANRYIDTANDDIDVLIVPIA